MTAGFAGSKYGVVIVWAALAGAILKWVLNEGVARWQMATGTTLLEGWSDRLGAWIRWVFFVYLLIWSAVTGAALMLTNSTYSASASTDEWYMISLITTGPTTGAAFDRPGVGSPNATKLYDPVLLRYRPSETPGAEASNFSSSL